MDKLSENKVIDTTPNSGTFLNTLRNAAETRLVKFTAAGAILFGAATLSACASDKEVVAEPPSTSQEVVVPDTTETETPVEKPVISINDNDPMITSENEAAILESLRFTSDLSPQAVGEKYSEIITRWSMAGATSETFYKWFNAGLPDAAEFASAIAKDNANTYATALFGEDYASNSYAINFVKGAEEGNAGSIIGFLRTYGDKDMPNSNPLNKEPLQVEYKTLDVTVVSESDVKLVLAVKQQSDINDENTMFAGKLPYDGNISDTYLSFIANPNAEGSIKISTLDINNTP